jgi:hypothetical protein
MNLHALTKTYAEHRYWILNPHATRWNSPPRVLGFNKMALAQPIIKT